MDILFGNLKGDHIRFEVLGPTCPNADENWYRAQLNAEIHINVGTFRGYRSLVIFSDDFHLFRAGLKRLLSGEAVSASLEAGDFLSVEVSAEGCAYNVWMQLDALDRDGEIVLRDGGAENWEWRLAIDRISFDALVEALTRVSDHYPIWSIEQSSANASTETWTVHRLDDNGNRFIVEQHLNHVAAEHLVKELEARGHKQYYWMERETFST